jgi:hypothetical protein
MRVDSFDPTTAFLAFLLVLAVIGLIVFLTKMQRSVTESPWIMSEVPWDDVQDSKAYLESPSYMKSSRQSPRLPPIPPRFRVIYPVGESRRRVATSKENLPSLHSITARSLEPIRFAESQMSQGFSIYDSGLSSETRFDSIAAPSSVTMNTIVESETSEGFSIYDSGLSSKTRFDSIAASSLVIMNTIVESQMSEGFSICDSGLSSMTTIVQGHHSSNDYKLWDTDIETEDLDRRHISCSV